MEILKRDIRQNIVSGLFYPETEAEQKKQVEEFLKKGSRDSASLILCPHGSWENTGEAIGKAFASAADSKPELIVLLGPVHREKAIEKISLPSKKYFESAQGLQKVDQKLCSELCRSRDTSPEIFIRDDIPHQEEHALELTLPFIKNLFPDSTILPMLMGDLKRSEIKKASKILKKALFKENKSILFVLSANLSRFGFLEETEKEAEKILPLMDLPLHQSLIELYKQDEISSCGIRILTLLSDVFNTESLPFQVLHKTKVIVNEKNRDKAVFYASGKWGS